jgi:hypothetical protein
VLPLNAAAKWGMIAVLIALDAAGLVHCGIHLAWPGLVRVGGAVLMFTALGFFYVRWRPEERLADLAHSAARLLVFFAAMGVLSYLVATTGRPVTDDLLARADRALGFDWLSWFAFVQQRPTLHRVLHLAYMSALPQIAIITAYLALTGQKRRNSELFWTLAISLLIIVPISGLLPAFNASVYYDVSGFRQHMPDFIALRTARLEQLDLSRLQGLISFPSFHTTLAVLFPYVARGRPVALLAAVLVNSAMIVAIPTEGSHYLVDVLAGAAVAFAAIVATARIEALLERRRSQPALAAAE